MTINEKTPIIENRWVVGSYFHYVRHSGISRIDPVYRSRFILKVPEAEEFVYHMNRLTVSPIIKKEGGFSTYTWEVSDLPAIPIEEAMPPIAEIVPAIHLSSLKGWDEIDGWASGLFLPRLEASPEVQSKAQELIRGAQTEEEKIAALFHFIQTQIEYVIADLGLGGYKPHAPQETLKNLYGDCKNQVTLFLSMLRVIGIPAYPALINPFQFGEVIKEIPSPYFPHLIAYIPRDGGDIWLDTTSSVTGFPSLLWADQNRWAFVIDGKGGKFLKTPSARPEDNQGSIKIRLSFEDQTLNTKKTIEGKGGFSDGLKSAFKPLRVMQQEERMRRTLKSWHPNAQIQSIEFSDLENPQAPFKVTARLDSKNVWEKSMRTFSYSVNGLEALLFFTEFGDLPPPENRRHDFPLKGKLLLVNEQVYAPPADDYRPNMLPQDESLDTRLLSFHRTFAREGDSVKARWELRVKQDRIHREDYKEFYESIEEVRKQSFWQVSFTRQKIDKEGLALEEAVKDKPGEAPSLVNLARHYLTKGKYKEAKELLEEAVNLDPSSGEVRYFLGMALSFLEQYAEGRAEMEKAKELGYLYIP